MRTLHFNFNNEADLLTIVENDDLTISVPELTTGESFPTIQAFADAYAIARNVTVDNLKNWELIVDGTVVSYVLRAGTAGVTSDEIQEELAEVIETLLADERFTRFEVLRISYELEGADDVLETLLTSSESKVAQVIFDMLSEKHVELEGQEEIIEEEEVDPRSDMEIILDNTLEVYGSLAIYAYILRLPVTATKEEILEKLEDSTSIIQYTTDILHQMYDVTVETLMQSFNTSSLEDIIILLTQSPLGATNDTIMDRFVQVAGLAGREGINILVTKVGRRRIIRESEYVLLTDLADKTLYMYNDYPTMYLFDPSFDEVEETETEEI